MFVTSAHACRAGKTRKPEVRKWLTRAPSPLLATAAHGLRDWASVPVEWRAFRSALLDEEDAAVLISGFGRFIFWEKGSLYIGSAVVPSELHSHHAIQLSLGLQGKLQFKDTPASEWIEYDGAVIPPDLPHTFQAPGRVLAHIFTQPESQLGRQILRRFGSQQISRLSAEEAHRLAEPLKQAYFNDFREADLMQIARQACAQLVGAMEPEDSVDPRILLALTEIDRRLDGSLCLGEIASCVGLSEGRFRHLFVTETGVAFRPYVLWARLNRALALGYSGVSWTEAAHAAYFADSAHLTRTCRRMFGIAPSSIKIPVEPS